jgi:hypothetical protein
VKGRLPIDKHELLMLGWAVALPLTLEMIRAAENVFDKVFAGAMGLLGGTFIVAAILVVSKEVRGKNKIARLLEEILAMLLLTYLVSRLF